MAFSKYFDDLPADLEVRYQQKVILCEGNDPYELPKAGFSAENAWPSVSYPEFVYHVMLATSSVTHRQRIAYQSL